MKTKTLLVAALAGLMLSSCGITKNGDFASRKYTKFRKGDAKIEINTTKATVESAENIVISNEQSTANETESFTELRAEIKIQPVIKTENVLITDNSVKSDVTYRTKEKPAIKFKGFHKMIMNRLVDKPNTASINDANASQVVLVILAIFIPPLAVALARGIGSEFWIDLLLTILFFLPGMIYAILIVLDAI